MRTCTLCKLSKEETTEFFYTRGISSKRKDGTIPFHPQCKVCTKARVKAQTDAIRHTKEFKEKIRTRNKKNSKVNSAKAKEWKENNPDKTFDTYLRRLYGITLVEYTEMETQQKFKCKICRTSDFSAGRGNRMVVDHCHESGEVRGLLCHGCNVGLGSFRDDPRILKKAIKYLYGN